MKRIITAINNPKLNEALKKEKNFEVVGKDLLYKEAILEILEKDKNIDIIIFSENLMGEIKLEELIKKIKYQNNEIKIIFILEEKNNNLEKILEENKIKDIYYNNKINLKELIKIINKKEINMEEEIINLKKIIEEKNIKEQENEKNKKEETVKKEKQKQLEKVNMSTKIITFSGNIQSGRSALALIISYILSKENNKVLLIDGDIKKQDLSFLLRDYKKKNLRNKKKCKRFKYSKYKKLKNDEKNIYYFEIKKELKLFTTKINDNLYFFNKLKNILKDKKRIFLEIIKEKYNFIIIDLSKDNFENINLKFIKDSHINFLLLESDIIEIIQSKKYIEQMNIKIKNLQIILNKNNIFSIDKKLIQKFLLINNKILKNKKNKINFNLIYQFAEIKKLIENKKIKKEINKIINIVKKEK